VANIVNLDRVNKGYGAAGQLLTDVSLGLDDDARVDDRDELLTALRSLPPRMRAVVVLRYWLECTERETAAELGCSVGAVKSQASRGLQRLRTALDGAMAPGTNGGQ
jgi:RNA polymerase sigma factor (sigma-70 family)